MPLEFIEESDDGLIEIKASGHLHSDECRTFVRDFERAIGRKGEHSLLFDLEDFRNWDAGSVWEDLRFGNKHLDSFERVALVGNGNGNGNGDGDGDGDWECWAEALCRPFKGAEIRYFEPSKIGLARNWVRYGRLDADTGSKVRIKECQAS